MYQLLKSLIPARPSVSGRESGIRDRIAALMRPLCDEVKTDALGNLICFKRGSGEKPRRILLSAHMDEIGFIVNYIEEKGFVRVAPIGGIDYTAAVGCEVVFENGTRGVLVCEGDRKREEAPRAEKCYVDIGARDRKEAARHVAIGDTCALRAHVTRLLGSRVTGRPLDNRAGCALLVAVAESLTAPVDDIYYVFSVQEEVGCRGASPAAFGIAPALALIFDVTATGDAIGVKPMSVKLGAGAAVKIKDNSVICDTALVSALLAAAKAEGIAVQSEILTFGGTDTSAVQMAGLGCRAGAISIPCRYIHSGVEMIDMKDMEAALALTVRFLGGKV